MTNIDQTQLQQMGLAHSASSKPKDKLGQEDFMRLMITQLTNQDPFQPMESGEFLGQLAQFGTVSGINDMQKSFQQLAASLQGNQALQAAALVDKEVQVGAREAYLPPSGQMRGVVDVPQGVTRPVLDIFDLTGSLVARVPLTLDGSGKGHFQWDGAMANGSQAPAGFYELSASGNYDGQNVALETLVSGRVESVSVGGRNGGLALTVTGLGEVDFSRVRGISN